MNNWVISINIQQLYVIWIWLVSSEPSKKEHVITSTHLGISEASQGAKDTIYNKFSSILKIVLWK